MTTKILFLIFILIVIFTVAGCNFPDLKIQEQQTTTSDKNEPAIDFELQTLDGETIKLSAYKKEGKVVVLIFGATWCPPCKEEFPHVQNFYKNTDKEKVEIIWIYTNEKENVVTDFRDKYGLEFPIAYDETGDVYDQYEVSSIPKTVFINKTGEMDEIKVGAMSEDDLKENVGRLMGNE